MNDQPLSVEYELGFDDRLEAVDYMFDPAIYEPMIRKMKRRGALIGLGLMTLSGLVVFGLIRVLGWSLSGAGYTILYFPCVFIGLWWGYKHRLTPIVRQRVIRVAYDICRGTVGPGFDGPVSLRIEKCSLAGSDGWRSWELHWPFIRSIKRGANITGIELLDTRWIVIPRSAFVSEDAYHWFVDEIDQRNEDAGGLDTTIVNHLQVFTLACAKCNYPLHKSPTSRCPECGRDIELIDFRANSTERATE